jgi:hypothetical protein
MTVLLALSVMSFMGLQLPAIGSAEQQLPALGFSDSRSDVPASYESRNLHKTMVSKVLGRVRVSVVTVKAQVRTLSVACLPARRCNGKESIPAVDHCHAVTRSSWRCSQDGLEFDVRRCGRYIYFLMAPGEEFPQVACDAFGTPGVPRK